jgi:RecB family exonuclease
LSADPLHVVLDYVSRHLPDRRQVFVFPSEIVAASWRRRVLDSGPNQAIRSDRFISWDRFKEACFGLTREARPVNRLVRTLFAASLLRQNAEGPLLFRRLVEPQFADEPEGFARFIADTLPRLQALRDARCFAALDGVDRELAGDLDTLYRRYGEFLDANGMFEPNYQPISLQRMSSRYHLFFTEVTEDYEDYAAILEQAPGVCFPDTPSEPAGGQYRFPTVHQELRWLFQALGDALDGGIAPEDMAVTVPRLEDYADELILASRLYQVPLDIRRGRSLAEHAPGRFFGMVNRLVSTGFSLAAFKAMALHQGFPWRDRETLRALMRLGVDYSCVRNYHSGEERVNVWEHALGKVRATGAYGSDLARRMAEQYRRLEAAATAMVRARGFGDLIQSVHRFTKQMLLLPMWDEQSRLVYQSCLDALYDCAAAAELFDGPLPSSPYAVWMQALADRIYVPRSDSGGVPVYPYRVSAGLACRRHFLINAGHEATTVSVRRFPFLREDQAQAIGVRDRDLSQAFLRLYLGSGESVETSYSVEGLSGPALASGYFVTRDAVMPGPDVVDQDPYSRETAFWEGASEERFPPVLFPAQRAGYDRMAHTGFRPPALDMAARALQVPQLVATLRSRLERDGALPVSPTRLEVFLTCPFQFLANYALGMEEVEYEPDTGGHKAGGTLVHRALARLFEEIEAEDGVYLAGRLEHYRDRLASYLDNEAAAMERDQPLPIPPVWRYHRDWAAERLDRFVDVERESFGGARVVATESEQELPPDDESIVFHGRIDRVSATNDGVVLVDYKRSRTPGPSDVRGSAGRFPASLQLAFYSHLVRTSGMQVAALSYYSLGQGKYRHVYHAREKSFLDEEELADAMDAVVEGAHALARSVRTGDYRARPGPHCGDCSFRSVCRARYAVRRIDK